MHLIFVNYQNFHKIRRLLAGIKFFSLIREIRFITGERAVPTVARANSCDQCTASYAKRQNLLQHMIRVHKTGLSYSLLFACYFRLIHFFNDILQIKCCILDSFHLAECRFFVNTYFSFYSNLFD